MRDERSTMTAQSSRWEFRAPEPEGPISAGAVPTFSVVIAAYNVAPYLEQAINSALDQTLAPREVIVCDDGSTDDIEGAVAPFGDRIVFLRQLHAGEAAAKNRGTEAATGDFVAFFDGDDVQAKVRLEAMGELAALRPDLDILTTNCTLVDEEGRVLRTYLTEGYGFGVTDQRREIFERNFLPSPAIRRSRLLEIGGFDERLSHHTDVDCAIRLIFSGSRAGLVDAPLFVYRQWSGQMTSDQVTAQRSRLEMLERLEQRSDLSSDDRSIMDTAAHRTRLMLARAMVRANTPGWREASRQIARDRGYPFRTRAKAALVSIATPIPRRPRAAR